MSFLFLKDKDIINHHINQISSSNNNENLNDNKKYINIYINEYNNGNNIKTSLLKYLIYVLNQINQNEFYQNHIILILFNKKKQKIKVFNNTKRYHQLKFVLFNCINLLEQDNHSTIRDLYYKNVELFQKNQNQLIRTIRSLVTSLNIQQYNLNLFPGLKGLVFGNLFIETFNNDIIDCTINPRGTLIPGNENIIKSLKTNSKFILIVEKESIFHSLIHVFKRLCSCPFILITGKGYPDNSTRFLAYSLSNLFYDFNQDLFIWDNNHQSHNYKDNNDNDNDYIKNEDNDIMIVPDNSYEIEIEEEEEELEINLDLDLDIEIENKNIPIYVLTDCDPHGISIFNNYKYGSINNQKYNSHKLKWLGIQYNDWFNNKQYFDWNNNQNNQQGIISIQNQDIRKIFSNLQYIQNKLYLCKEKDNDEYYELKKQQKTLSMILLLNKKTEIETINENILSKIYLPNKIQEFITMIN